MRTGDDENAGTPISYAVEQNQYVQENGLVLKDYGNLAIQINNQTGYIVDRLNDGHWHHVAITWRSSHGIWAYYRDGKEIKRAADPIAKGKITPQPLRQKPKINIDIQEISLEQSLNHQFSSLRKLRKKFSCDRLTSSFYCLSNT
jgi:hypothetical protein